MASTSLPAEMPLPAAAQAAAQIPVGQAAAAQPDQQQSGAAGAGIAAAANGSRSPEKQRRQHRKRYAKKVADAAAAAKPIESIADASKPEAEPKPNQAVAASKRRRGRGGGVNRGPDQSQQQNEATRRLFNQGVNKQTDGVQQKEGQLQSTKAEAQQNGLKADQQPNGPAAAKAGEPGKVSDQQQQPAPKKRYRPRRRKTQQQQQQQSGVENNTQILTNKVGVAVAVTNADGATATIIKPSGSPVKRNRRNQPRRERASADQAGADGALPRKPLPFGVRLFGRFVCTKCTHNWSSVNAWRGKKQACKLCGKMSIAEHLSFLYRRRRPEAVEAEVVEGTKDDPAAAGEAKEVEIPVKRLRHPQHLCEMCLTLGFCCREKVEEPQPESLEHKENEDEAADVEWTVSITAPE